MVLGSLAGHGPPWLHPLMTPLQDRRLVPRLEYYPPISTTRRILWRNIGTRTTDGSNCTERSVKTFGIKGFGSGICLCPFFTRRELRVFFCANFFRATFFRNVPVNILRVENPFFPPGKSTDPSIVRFTPRLIMIRPRL